MNNFSTFSPKLIYVFAIHDDRHFGCLKIGETTCSETDFKKLTPNSESLNEAARRRIDQYTQTAGVAYELLYTEPSFYIRDGGFGSFNDKEVHDILLRSGVKRKEFDKKYKANEWFITDLDTVKAAIRAAKEGRASLTPDEARHEDEGAIQFRPEQRAAIDKTKRCFRRQDSMLWNAKMRFGKTVCALQLVKEMGIPRTIILTHRPVVDSGWYDDFKKIFGAAGCAGGDMSGWLYGSRGRGERFDSLMHSATQGHKVIWFASMQDLRGSDQVGGKFDKNYEVFSTHWDLLIVDEAHEGTQTTLGQAVIRELRKEGTKLLSLSGTPFNLLEQYDEESVYTWDYIMEQAAKNSWDEVNQGDPNPYACLPRMNIWTYNLGKLSGAFIDEDKAFNFREFFRTDEAGSFVHAGDVRGFLDLMTFKDEQSLYPFATSGYRDIFRHTLWVMPGVKEARALSGMLKDHPTFQYYQVVNVAGAGDKKEDDEESDEALSMVRRAIGGEPDKSHTITLTCGRLTTGVSVPEWTAVLMLSGSAATSAASYMQTIFRVQTPATIAGRMKTDCYVFDFAPDRTLKVLAEVAKLSSRESSTGGDRQQMGAFLNFCPVIAIEGSAMSRYDADRLLQQLKKVYVERVVKHGFEDARLYNDKLLKLDDVQLELFDDLKRIIGTTKAMHKMQGIDINNQGLSDEEYEQIQPDEPIQPVEPKERTPEEEERLRQLMERRKNRDAAVSILRGISIRMPLMLYGAEVKDEDSEITIDNFTQLIDDRSWEEFMPRGVTKEIFGQFKRYYDGDIFAAAGKRIRSLARAADEMGVTERIKRISEIFATFRNPDKETVLTPWRVVNMHLGDTLGGWVFFGEDYTEERAPRYVEREGVTRRVFKAQSRILEINSKTGLYPLYCAYSIWRSMLEGRPPAAVSQAEQLMLWDKAVGECLFVVCKTPMAASITRRTLVGFRKSRVNARYAPGLVDTIKRESARFIKEVRQGKSYWGANEEDNMKFDAVVGNPPYQVMDGGGTGSSAIPVYQHFVGVAKQLEPKYISMIMPSRWMTGGKGLDAFREVMINDVHISLIHDFMNSHDCFPAVEIEGGVCYILWKSDHEGKCEFVSHSKGTTVRSERYLSEYNTDVVVRDVGSLSILSKVYNAETTFMSIVMTRNLFKVNIDELSDDWSEGDTKVFGRYESTRGIKYLADYQSTDERAMSFLGKWKVFVSKADGAAGQLGNPIPARIIGKMEIGDPQTICTETFLAIGPFNTQIEAEHVAKYAQTKLFRFMVGIRKLKNMTQDTYMFVPLQDFTAASDIDWGRSVEEVDAQLYDKYGLDTEERAFIERMIKPMV